MTLIQLILLLAVVFIVAVAAHWLITKFLEPPVRNIALLVVGVILLIVLLVNFFPGVGNYQIWK